ncbi:MAG: hypothetical protein ABMA25_18110, partial [Ilumatobacteraceae bacterium]
VQVDAGIGFTCVLLASGGVTCFGKGFNGELGYGVGGVVIGDNETPANNPANGGYVPMPNDQPAVGIASGDSHTCALLSSGDVTCWGSSAHGQLGYGQFIDVGYTTTPADAGVVALPSGGHAIAISAGGDTTCAILTTHEVACWGFNSRGQLGYAIPQNIGDDETPADNIANGGVVALPGDLGAAAIDVGYLHVCASLTDGTVTCWGAGNDTQLGYGNQIDIGDNETPADNPVDGGIVQLPYGQPALAISSGHGHTCAILVPDGLACWGNNGNGQLGYGNTNILGSTDKPISNPVNSGYVPLPGEQGVVAVSANDTYTCAILDGGQTTCWGYNGGQLGYGNIGNAFDIGDNELIGANPVNGGYVRLPGPDNVVEVGTGYSHTCALMANGRVTCWGFGSSGELGSGSTATIGDNETAAQSTSNGGYVRLPGNQRVVHLAVGGFHTCALLVSGEITCWGYGGDGALGYGNTNSIGDNETPAANPANFGIVPLPSSHTAVAITAGDAHTCAILDNGEVSCWGDGSDGKLGYGNTLSIGDNEDPSAEPTSGGIVALPGSKGAVAIDAGGSSTCAILTTGRITCWGAGNNGRLGYGGLSPIGDNETPAANTTNGGVLDLPGGLKAIDVSVGANHACAVLSDTTLTCWGYGAFGQLGYGNTNSIGDTAGETPATGGLVAMPGGQHVTAAAAGGTHTCARLASGSVACWGFGAAGQVGYGNTDIIGDDETPAGNIVNGGLLALPGGLGVLGLEANSSHSCAVLTDRSVSCWGSGQDGRLGSGNINLIGDSETPAANPVNAGRVPLPRSTAPVDYRPLVPARLLDTRTTGTTIDGFQQATGPVTGGTFVTLQVRGRGGVPVDAAAATLSIAAVGPTSGGFLTVWPCDVTMPLASSLNFQTGVNTANTVISKIARDGTVCIYTSKTTHLITDVVGNTPRTSSLTTLTPARLADTRATGDTIDEIGEMTGIVTSASPLHVDVVNRGGVPAGTRTVVLNVTAVGPAAGGYLTVHPCLPTTPLASNLNYSTGVTAANLVIAQVDGSNQVCIYTSQNTHLIVDVVGYFSDETPGPSWMQSFSPTRLADTRGSGVTIDGRSQATGQVAAGGVLTVQVANRFPTNAAAVATLNITAVSPAGNGFLTVWPCDQTQPTASSLNYVTGVTRAVQVLSKLSATGTVCVYTSKASHLIIDTTGATL